MLILFLRHAEAEPHREEDAARELTEKGRSQARRAGAFLRLHGLIPDVVLTSPLARARQTAAIIAREVASEMREAAFLRPGMGAELATAELRTWSGAERVLAVGHEPDFSETIGYLLGIKGDAPIKVRKASVIGIECDLPSRGRGVLQFVVPARLMP